MLSTLTVPFVGRRLVARISCGAVAAAKRPVPKPGPKPSLSREVVAEAALALVDGDGLGALNLRALGKRLGVSAMTPYSYFEDKADLLGAMLDRALAPLGTAAPGDAGWDEQLAVRMRGLHAALAEHPGLLELLMSATETARLDAFRHELIALLTDAGLGPEQSGDALRALTAYVLGYTAVERVRRPPAGERHSADPFEKGLQMILDSLRREAGG